MTINFKVKPCIYDLLLLIFLVTASVYTASHKLITPERTSSDFTISSYNPKKYAVRVHSWPTSIYGAHDDGAVAALFKARLHEELYFTADSIAITLEHHLKHEAGMDPKKALKMTLGQHPSFALSRMKCDKVAIMLWYAGKLLKGYGQWVWHDQYTAQFKTHVIADSDNRLYFSDESNDAPVIVWDPAPLSK